MYNGNSNLEVCDKAKRRTDLKQTKTISLAAAVAAISLGAILFAQEDARLAEVRGVFVKLIERQVGEKEYVGIVVRPLESDDEVTILTPREPENLIDMARKLKEGQKVEIRYAPNDGQNWLRNLGAEWQREDGQERTEERISVDIRRSGDQPRREVRMTERREVTPAREREGQSGEGIGAQIEQFTRQFREILAQVSQMEREMRGLRAENERLRRTIDELRCHTQIFDLVQFNRACIGSLNIDYGLILSHKREAQLIQRV